jgi:hypothetical protein
MTTLVRWGLAEAYLDGRPLSAEDLAQRHTPGSTARLSFYIAKSAVEIEESLGVAFDAAPTTLFGQSGHRERVDVFVLMPFTDALRPVYEEHIQPACSRLTLSAARADDFFGTGSIMGDIWHAINNAGIIIADCTGRNPNVFYEIGLAHARGKATILMAQAIDDIPFDLRHLRVITYEYSSSGLKKFENTLANTIQRLQWDAHLGRLPAVNRPIQVVVPGSDGWLECPYCSKRFNPSAPRLFGDGRHLSCGQRITIAGTS